MLRSWTSQSTRGRSNSTGKERPMLRVGQRVVKHKATGTLYEVIARHAFGCMCVRLSHYDGMPMGLPQYMLYTEVE